MLEIDGASNRGIDEIRQLRQNVAVRPSRARFKIYIIDEVHMLTKEAFNALLKTLEEPPEHVKFIFATTEANKIPITILSRCQRFDFAGIDTAAIQTRLAQIAAAEGVEIEPEALQILASRAAGSMRDSQSLLGAIAGRWPTSGSRPTTCNRCLGIAPAERLSGLVQHLVARDAAAALRRARRGGRRRRRSRAAARPTGRLFPRRDGGGGRLPGRADALRPAVASRRSGGDRPTVGPANGPGHRADSRPDGRPGCG